MENVIVPTKFDQIDITGIYLYAKNYEGYLNLLKIHTLKEFNDLTYEKMQGYLDNIKIVLPYNSYDINDKFSDCYLGYTNDTEKIRALLITDKVVYFKNVKVLRKDEVNYLKCLEAIDKGVLIKDVNTDKVSIGTTVTIKYVDDDETEEYSIVGSKEADPFENKISNESPIARAIMGLSVGDKVTVDSPNGKYDVEIVKIA